MSRDASAPTQPLDAAALAAVAFGSATGASQASRALAWTAPEDLGIDLDDPAQRRFGDYELVALIGRGGMGAVYRARQHGLDREVAVKFLAAGPWASDEFIERFRREARAAARMQHPNIVEIFDIGERDGLYWFSMRLVPGPTLAQRVRERGPLPPRAAAALVRSIAEAIDYAHRLGVLHLDLKPGNILLGGDGEPLVADFGLARRIDEGPLGAQDIAGTPSYMAPEQALASAHPIGPATDIYGLGAILYELLSGHPPFLGGTARSTLEQVVRDEPRPLRQLDRRIPADLAAIAAPARCLAKDPGQRYPSARALAEDLTRFLDGAAVQARQPALPERLRRWAARNRMAAAFMLAVVLGLGATAYLASEASAARDLALARAGEAERERARAEAQMRRSQQLAALIAHAFPAGSVKAETAALEGAAKRVVAWMGQELADQPASQGELLMALLDALDAADNPAAAQALLLPLFEQLGVAHRRQSAAAYLAAGGQRQRLYAAMLLQEWSAAEPGDRQRQQDLLAALLAEAPDDLDVLVVATYYCTQAESPCAALAPGRRLAEREPDNAANWVFALAEGQSADQLRALLRRAAGAPRFDDHFNRIWRIGMAAVAESPVPLPPLLEAAARRLAPEVAPAELLARFNHWTLPLPNWRQLAEACRHDRPEIVERSWQDDCFAIAQRATHDGQSLIANMLGSAIVRWLRPGSEAARLARERRREYLYAYAAHAARTPAQIRASREALEARELASLPELEVVKRTLDRAGIPRDPPPGWEPEDPEALMTALERDIYRQRKAALASSPLMPRLGGGRSR
jgi:tRNA A-37 threonylcarbamoyl transferase component Bud32